MAASMTGRSLFAFLALISLTAHPSEATSSPRLIEVGVGYAPGPDFDRDGGHALIRLAPGQVKSNVNKPSPVVLRMALW